MIDTSHEQGMSDQAFQKIAQIAISNAGLSIPSSKKALVQSRISRRLRALGLNTINEYLEIITDTSQNAERKELISILTTNVSSFYREEHHFSHLVSQIFPTIRKKISQNKTVRFWSSGCSSGQEPYTIGMEVLKYFNLNEQKNILILATDIDPVILKKAQMAIYSDTEMEPVRKNGCQKFFDESEHGNQISRQVRDLVRFRELNLHADWPMTGMFDAIFCRNVLIYFDDAHQRALWPRFHDILVPEGHLYLGHSERIHPIENSGFESVGATMYQRTS